MPVVLPSDPTLEGLFYGHIAVLGIGIVLAGLIYRRRNRPQVVCRGWFLLWVCSFGVSLYAICDSGLERVPGDEEEDIRDISDELLDFIGDIGALIFFAAVFIRCWRLKRVIDINELKDLAHRDPSQREVVISRTVELRRQLTVKWAVKWFFIIVLATFSLSIFAFFVEYGEEFVILDNILFVLSVSAFMIAFVVFAIILRRVDDLFRQSTEVTLLAIVCFAIGALEEYSFFVEDVDIWYPSCVLAVNIIVFGICLVFPLFLSYYSFGDAGYVPSMSRRSASFASDFQAPLINSLENVLHDVEGREKFRAFLERAFALENLFFYESVSEFVGIVNEEARREKANSIVQEFFNQDSPNELNLPSTIRERVLVLIRSNPPIEPSIFEEALRHTLQSMQLDLWPRFRKSREYQALVERYSRRSLQLSEFQGIGDSLDISSYPSSDL